MSESQVATLQKLLTSIGKASSAAPVGGEPEKLKQQGNQSHKAGDYSSAIRYYTQVRPAMQFAHQLQAIAAAPRVGVYYGNRAASWMMLKQYDRVVKDCSAGMRTMVVTRISGLALEQAGELGKLRLRMANALLLLNKVDRAADVLEVDCCV